MSSLYEQVVNEYEERLHETERKRNQDLKKAKKETTNTKIQTMVTTALNYGANKTMVLSDLMSHCGLNMKQAEAAYRKYAGE